MFHVASLEEKTLDSLKASLPDILQKAEQEALQRKEIIQRLEGDGLTAKIEEQQSKWA
jgi:hypothetical protein